MVGTGLQQYYEAILGVVSSVQESEIKDLAVNSALKRLGEEANAADIRQDGSIDIERGHQYYETLQEFQDSPFSRHGSTQPRRDRRHTKVPEEGRR